MGWYKTLLFHAKTIVRETCTFELRSPSQKEEERRRRKRKTIWLFWRLSCLVILQCLRATKSLVGHEALEDEWYVVIKGYHFRGFFGIIIYHVSALSRHTESTNSRACAARYVVTYSVVLLA